MSNVSNANKTKYLSKRRMPLCIAPFIGLFKISQRVSPCCEMWEGTYLVPFEEYKDSALAVETRRALLAHDYASLPDGCKTCLNSPTSHKDFYFLEDREYFSESYIEHENAFHEDGTVDYLPISHFALGTSNKCNMACRMCSPHISSKKLEVTEKLGITNDPDILPLFDEKFTSSTNVQEDIKLIRDNSEHLREFVLHGGDPIQAEGFPAIMDELLAHQSILDNCQINFLSNGTFYLMKDGRNIFELLKAFKSVNVVFSIDGVEDTDNYIRLYGSHKRTMKLIDIALETLPKHHTVCVHSTLSNYSAIYWESFLKWSEEELLRKRGIWLSVNVVNAPECYAPECLPADIKKDVMTRLNAYKPEDNHYKDLKAVALKALFRAPFKPSEWEKAMYMDREIDVYSGVDTYEIYPMLEKYKQNSIPLSLPDITRQPNTCPLRS